jgi:3-isopropylmalate dehydrogenase
MTTHKILCLPGDGIGPEVVDQAEQVLRCLAKDFGLASEIEHAPIGGAAYDAAGDPLPETTLAAARAADAVLLGAVGGPKWEALPRDKRPERGLLRIRSELGVFANLRPAKVWPGTEDFSPLKSGLLHELDLIIVRELTGDIYFGAPRGIEVRNGERVGYNTAVYSESEIRRIAKVAFEVARQRAGEIDRGWVCSVDKANVLESSELWREVVKETARDYTDVKLSHMYVDNAAMQLVRDPGQFDVIVTGNLFGDILSDIAAQITGSIGLLPSASLDAAGKGLYEPIHGSAPDIAGKGVANPLATILSVAMMLRYSFQRADLADRVESAVGLVLNDGLRTPDIHRHEKEVREVGTREMGEAVVATMRAQA